jgi:molecular chaperone DnaK
MKLAKEEIDKMIKDSEKFATEDAKVKEEIQTINQADALIYSVEKSLKDLGDKVPPQERSDIESKINDLKTAIKDKNFSSLKRAMKALTDASHHMAEELYKKTQPSQEKQGGTKEGPKGKDDQVIDAEFTDDEDQPPFQKHG